MAESRTAKSIKNISVALLFCALELILKFLSRKVFLDHLGTEVLGLNTTAISLLSFLNLAELGIGSAVAVTLYKPLFESNRNEICEIVSLQGWFYKRVALFVIFGSAILFCFFPLIFADMQLPLWYAYATFSVFLFSSLLSYFANYKQILLSADQKEYKVKVSYKFPILLKLLVQIVIISIAKNGYIWWLILEVFFAIFATCSLSYTIKKTYPYLKTSSIPGAQLAKQYPIVLTKIKQIFVHKIASFVLSEISPIIIYAYASLTLVALYGNYTMIISGLVLVLNSMFNSMGAGVGNLVAEGSKEQILRVFRELFTSRFLIVSTFTLGLYLFTDSFISLWVGPEYVLDKKVLLLVVLYFYLNTMRTVVESYTYAYGLFKDIWAPIAESVLNVGFSVLLGYYWGLHGILIAVNISLLVIVFCWKPYFLFSQGLKTSLSFYVKLYGKHLLVFIPLFLFFLQLYYNLRIDTEYSWISFLLYGFCFCALYFVIAGVVLYFVESGMKGFVNRMSLLILKRK